MWAAAAVLVPLCWRCVCAPPGSFFALEFCGEGMG